MRLAAVLLAACCASPLGAEIVSARYSQPTTRYDHGVLGDAVEYGALELTLRGGVGRRIVLPDTRVFEDLAPRLVDLDGDGAPEIIAVETDLSRGARISVYGPDGLIAATPFIGAPHRWLAPVGAADLDGDGRIEIAYVDRPHLLRLLRIWRFEDGRLTEIAQGEGLTNHRIGDDFISGGLRDCGDGPEMLLTGPDWRAVIAVRLEDGRVVRGALDLPATPRGFAAARTCR
jgi:hypothetical protein